MWSNRAYRWSADDHCDDNGDIDDDDTAEQ